MPAPSALVIATSSVTRLVREKEVYKKEMAEQELRIETQTRDISQDTNADENAEYQLRQERQALKQTQDVFPKLDEKIIDTMKKLRDEINAAEASGGQAEEVAAGKNAITKGENALK